MAVDLIDYVPSLKREIQPPGVELFASVTNDEWVGYLADAFWEARLDGFLVGYATDEDGTAIEPLTGTTEIPRQQIALIVLYAGIRVLRNKILNTKTMFRGKAGPTEFEQQTSATMLAEMLKQLKETKDRILVELDEFATGVHVLDAFSTRLFDWPSYHGGPELAG